MLSVHLPNEFNRSDSITSVIFPPMTSVLHRQNLHPTTHPQPPAHPLFQLAHHICILSMRMPLWGVNLLTFVPWPGSHTCCLVWLHGNHMWDSSHTLAAYQTRSGGHTPWEQMLGRVGMEGCEQHVTCEQKYDHGWLFGFHVEHYMILNVLTIFCHLTKINMDRTADRMD